MNININSLYTTPPIMHKYNKKKNNASVNFGKMGIDPNNITKNSVLGELKRILDMIPVSKELIKKKMATNKLIQQVKKNEPLLPNAIKLAKKLNFLDEKNQLRPSVKEIIKNAKI